MADTIHIGMRGTGDWATNERPESWREAILYLYPNGAAPLTAILSRMDNEPVDDPKYHWWTKTLPKQGGDTTNSGVYTDTLSTAYTSGGSVGDTLYVSTSAKVAKEFRDGHIALLVKKDDYRHNTRAYVKDSTVDGDNSYLTVELMEDANGTYDLDEIDRVLVVGNLNAEGDTIPDSVSYDPVQHTNVTQIFRTPLSITRTARKTRLRTGDAYSRMKKEALELHSLEIEKAFLDGQFFDGLGDNGKPMRATRGAITAVIENESDNTSAYNFDPDFSGDTWLQGGYDWLDKYLERIFRFGDTQKLAFCGSGALQALNKLARNDADIKLEPGALEYGIRVMTWFTPYGEVHLKTHPLMSFEETKRNSMFIFEPQKLVTRTIDDTFFKEDKSEERNTNNSKDATDEEFLTEIGLEYNHTPCFGFLSNLGKDNTL